MKDTVVILCGGGPAPGINTVISTITKVFLSHKYRVIGLKQGYKTLFDENPSYDELDHQFAENIAFRGGSALPMSRYKPKDEEFSEDFFIKENIKLLVTIGGDDTASTANRIRLFLEEKGLKIQNIHVPKTIDNDLPLKEGVPTFGFNSAINEGVKITQTVYEDAKTSHNWFILSAMGREAGHLALKIGSSSHLSMIIIPEMFESQSITFDKIVKLIISSIIKRRIQGFDYGAAIVSEGIFHFMDESEIINSGITFTYDEHGHPELFSISKAHIFKTLVQRELRKIGLPVNTRPVELGFELRCCHPNSYDLDMCTQLGLGVYKLFSEGATGCLVALDSIGNIEPLYLNDISDPTTKKVIPRLVNMKSEQVQNIYKHQLDYLLEEDLDAAKSIIKDPEKFLYHNILNSN
ncbi:6-phosphofructokinase [Aureibacter tunicatorum]|uniref:6-phosphofructokinase 1 n=1 Tax=Aureibacter tunicatorum TaxID=866807 RepID=A0AAE4BR45_9BACT|nr:6-phosphofructokinase [Aureibacter tunicatorum]MDR6239844.1 6-phosphofructokinase 1 [Aureibacter tunicatorum]BDD04319.1 pyrophosphate--fructose 6-phosphate 1-phosphotransferase [Aureibacter tunicatorum]